MRASDLADGLRSNGVPVIGVLEPTRFVDGAVLVTNHVYVQVPFDEQLYPPGVVRGVADEEWAFYDCTDNMERLLRDIDDALVETDFAVV